MSVLCRYMICDMKVIYMLHDTLDTVASVLASYVLASASEFFLPRPRPHTFWPRPRRSTSTSASSFSGLINKRDKNRPSFAGGHLCYLDLPGHGGDQSQTASIIGVNSQQKM